MHDEYWQKVKENAEDRICKLFENCKTKIRDILGNDNGIDSFHDAKKVLAYSMKHGDFSEKACAILSFSEWLHAVHELKERDSEGAEHASKNK